jgi:hypothetical protein
MNQDAEFSAAFVYCLFLFICPVSAHAQDRPVVNPDAREASGIAVQGSTLIIVDDEAAGGFFRYPLSQLAAHGATQIDPERLEWVKLGHAEQGALALDLEAVDVLCRGSFVVLSERLRMLFNVGNSGIISGRMSILAEYDDSFGETGDRGLEGVTVTGCSSQQQRVAVLWEGGYMATEDLPPSLVAAANKSYKPLIFIHGLVPDDDPLNYVADYSLARYVELQVPLPPGREPSAQRFRAPDLVWHQVGDEEDWGWIVLLNSSSIQPKSFDHLWLQRFDNHGLPVGDPLDLNEHLPDAMDLNWEGLDWFEEGKSLVLVDDKSRKRRDGPPYVAVVELPRDWQWQIDD